MTDQIKAEALHRDTDPAEELDQEVHFSEALRAIAKQEHRVELRLPDCDIAHLEATGHVKEHF